MSGPVKKKDMSQPIGWADQSDGGGATSPLRPHSSGCEHLDEGNRLMDQGDLSGAIGAFGRSVLKNPKNAEAFNCRGLAYLQSGKIDKAAEEFGKAIRLSPKNLEYLRNRIDAHIYRKDFRRVCSDYSAMIRVAPKRAYLYCERGQAYMQLDSHTKAISDYSKAMRLVPEWARPVYNRALAYEKRHQYDKALEDYSKAIKLDPEWAMPYCDRGMAFDARGDKSKALADYDKAIKLNPNWSLPVHLRSLLLNETGKNKEAVAGAREWVRRHPTDVASCFFLLSILMRNKDADLSAEADRLKAAAKPEMWEKHVFDFFAGRQDADGLLRMSKSLDPAAQRRQIYRAQYYLAIGQLAKQNREGCRRALKACISEGLRDGNSYECDYALRLWKNLERQEAESEPDKQDGTQGAEPTT